MTDGSSRSLANLKIRPYQASDWEQVWCMLEPVFRAGETYGVATDIAEHDASAMWTHEPARAFVAEVSPSEQILGTYFLRPNFGGPGGHVCNCGYVVAAESQGQGIASQLCEHSQVEAKRRGYRAMQFNYVASSNAGAVRLWQRLGFKIVGTLPDAFRHPSLGFMDSHVMFKSLMDSPRLTGPAS